MTTSDLGGDKRTILDLMKTSRQVGYKNWRKRNFYGDFDLAKTYYL